MSKALDLRYPLSIFIIFLISFSFSRGQENADITRSLIIEEYNGKEYYVHFVKPGQTLYAISRVYNVSKKDIILENPELKKGILKVNQILKIPVNKVLVNDNHPVNDNQSDTLKYFFRHTVKPGETLYYLSRKYHVSIDELIDINPDIKYGTQVGQVILIPKKSYLTEDMIQIQKDTLVYYISHKVKKKETIYGLSKQYNIRMDDLFLLNPILKDGLKKKQIVKIPVKNNGQYDDISSGYLIVYSYIEKPETIDPDVQKKHNCDSFSYDQKVLEVAMLLPLYLDQLGDITIDDTSRLQSAEHYRPFRFIQFYEGALLAIDSLINQGLRLKLYIYDIDDDPTKIRKLLTNPHFSEMDMIVGPFYRKSFKIASGFAKANNILIVNPFTKRESVLDDNQTVFKVQPSLETQIRKSLDFILTNYPNANILLVRQNKYQYAEESQFIKEEIEKGIIKEISIPNTRIFSIIVENSLADTTLPEDAILESIIIENSVVLIDFIEQYPADSMVFKNTVKEIIFDIDSMHGICKHSSVVRDNVILSVSKNNVFILDFITRLNLVRDSFNIVLFGIPEWDNFDLETDYLLNLRLHTTTTTSINYEDEQVQQFISKFHRFFYCEPEQGKYSFEGFDITYFFLRELMHLGTYFQDCISEYNMKGLQQGFEFVRTEGRGFKNNYVRIVKYEEYKKVDVSPGK